MSQSSSPRRAALSRRAALRAPLRLLLPGLLLPGLLLPGLLLPVRRAAAHAVLASSIPPANTSIPAGSFTFVLRFNSRVDQSRSRLTMMGPDGLQTVLTIFPSGEPDVLTATGIVAAGGQSLRWQVLAGDGHITRGEIPFKAVRG